MDMETKVYEHNPIGPVNIFPSQFYSGTARLPEQRLMLAVFNDAVEICLRYKNSGLRRGRRLSRKEERWFQSTNATGLFSFENICVELNLDAGAVRRYLFGP